MRNPAGCGALKRTQRRLAGQGLLSPGDEVAVDAATRDVGESVIEVLAGSAVRRVGRQASVPNVVDDPGSEANERRNVAHLGANRQAPSVLADGRLVKRHVHDGGIPQVGAVEVDGGRAVVVLGGNPYGTDAGRVDLVESDGVLLGCAACSLLSRREVRHNAGERASDGSHRDKPDNGVLNSAHV